MKYTLLYLLFVLGVLTACQKDPDFRRPYPHPVKDKPSKDTLYPAVIYLDFDGDTVTGTAWNAGGPAILCKPSGLSEAQQAEAVDSVALKYSLWKVTVTRDSALYAKANPKLRQRVVITQSYEWYSNQYGGTSYPGSFSWGDGTPCFVFSSLFGYSLNKVWIACAHEVGHTLGLRHQAKYDSACNKLSEYNDGGTSPDAPIMGMAYSKHAIWWVGPNPYGCTAIQNDVELISQVLSRR